MEKKNSNAPNCFGCKFFYVSWDKNYPYGCRAFSIKSKKIPSGEVQAKSNMSCLYFSKKERRTEGSFSKDIAEFEKKSHFQGNNLKTGGASTLNEIV